MAVLWDQVGAALDVLDFAPASTFLKRGSGNGGALKGQNQPEERGSRWYDHSVDTRCRFGSRRTKRVESADGSRRSAHDSYLAPTKRAEKGSKEKSPFLASVDESPSRASRLESGGPLSAGSALVGVSGRNRLQVHFGKADSESDEDHHHPDHHCQSLKGLREVKWDDTPSWDRYYEGYGGSSRTAEITTAAEEAVLLSSALRSEFTDSDYLHTGVQEGGMPYLRGRASSPRMRERSNDSDAWWIGYR